MKSTAGAIQPSFFVFNAGLHAEAMESAWMKRSDPEFRTGTIFPF
jgi:hypothetical protein